MFNRKVVLKPYDRRWYWLCNWEGRMPYVGSDEYGWATLVLPYRRGRAVVISIYPNYLRCPDCYEARKQTLELEQDNYYIQTYWNVEYDDVFDLSNDEWDEALGVVRTRVQV